VDAVLERFAPGLGDGGWASVRDVSIVWETL
jgi:hypothetical protein